MKFYVNSDPASEYELLEYTSSATGKLEALVRSTSGMGEILYTIRQFDRPNRQFRYIAEGSDFFSLKQSHPTLGEFSDFVEGSISHQVLEYLETQIP